MDNETITQEANAEVFVIAWDTYDIARSLADETIEQLEHDENRTLTDDEKDKIFEDVSGDSWLFEDEWNSEMEYLTEVMNRINPDGVWWAEGSNLGWRHLSGHKAFEATTGKKLMEEILPKTDCTFKVYEVAMEGGGSFLGIRNSHHDAPMGEHYRLDVAQKCEKCGEIVENNTLTEDDDYGMICKECFEWVNN